MGAFELNDIMSSESKSGDFHEKIESKENVSSCGCKEKSHNCGCDHHLDQRRIREENIIALKVYDSCRQLHCNKIILKFLLLKRISYNIVLHCS